MLMLENDTIFNQEEIIYCHKDKSRLVPQSMCVVVAVCVTLKPNFPVHVCVSCRLPLQPIPPIPKMGSQAANQKQSPCDSCISRSAHASQLRNAE